MAPASVVDSNPFIDPITSSTSEETDGYQDSTLTVGRNTSLSLATDSLIILGKYMPLIRVPASSPLLSYPFMKISRGTRLNAVV